MQQVLSEDPDDAKCQSMFRMIKKMDKLKEEANSAFKEGKHQQAVDLYSQARAVDPGNDSYNSVIYCNRSAC